MAELTQWKVTVSRIVQEMATVIIEADLEGTARKVVDKLAEHDAGSLDWQRVDVIEDPEVVAAEKLP